MTKVNEGVFFIQGQDEFLPDSHVYVIGDPTSNDLSVIDVGLTGKGGYKIQSIKKMGIELGAIKRIIMTHTHRVYGMNEFKGMCQMQYGLKADAFKFKVDRKLEDGDKLGMGGMNWEVIHIPGHSMGGIALYHSSLKLLIPGDVIYADYAIGRFDLHGADADQGWPNLTWIYSCLATIRSSKVFPLVMS